MPSTWLIFNEYETYQSDSPHHAWTYIKSYESKEKALQATLEYNYNSLCKNMYGRWNPNHPKKTPTKSEELRKIVSYILNNMRTNTDMPRNAYFGLGYFMIESNKLTKSSTYFEDKKYILDFRSYLKEKPKEHDEDEKHRARRSNSPSDSLELDNSSSDEYDEEDEYTYDDSYSDSDDSDNNNKAESNIHQESDSGSDVNNKLKNHPPSKNSDDDEESDEGIYSS